MNDINIQQKLNTEVSELLVNFLTKKTQEESYLRFYTGKVEDNKDPEKLGRCKIRVYNVFGDDIPKDELPWAIPDFGFIGSTVGSFIVPPPDAIVKVYFDQGDIYHPRYTTKVLDKPKLSSERTENYPDTMVFFETDQGEYFKINRKTMTSTYRTAAGIIITMDKEGVLLVERDDSKWSILADDSGNVSITNTGKTTIDTTGEVSVSTKGNAKVDALGTVTISSMAQLALSSPSGTKMWKPNILPVCLFSGAPHAMPTDFIGK